MSLLINVCCGPCCLPIAEVTKEATLFFYSPNIYPLAEYQKRLAAARQAAAVSDLPLIEGEYDHDNWLAFIRQSLSKPADAYQENSERCRACFSYRIEQTAKYAKDNGFDRFAMTLSVNRFKDTVFINAYAKEVAEKLGLQYIKYNLDAGQAHQRGTEIAKANDIYRQRYCGCEFSLPR